MGVLNVTPDSFYDGGRYATFEKALRHAERMVEEGADYVDETARRRLHTHPTAV